MSPAAHLGEASADATAIMAGQDRAHEPSQPPALRRPGLAALHQATETLTSAVAVGERDSLPEIPGSSGQVTVSVATSSQPERVELKLFDSVSAGVPAGEQHSIECTQLCGTPTAGGRVALRIKVPANTKVVVLMLFWAVPLDQAHPQSPVTPYDYASYAFRSAAQQ
jgi:hypothetical protein